MGVRAKGKWESVGVSAERGSSVTTEGGEVVQRRDDRVETQKGRGEKEILPRGYKGKLTLVNLVV